jgi:hypothetical protein
MDVELNGTGFFIGRKAPVKVVPGDQVHLGSVRYADGLKRDDPLVDRFLELRRFKGFVSFCETYGPLMFRPLLEKKATGDAGPEQLFAASLIAFIDWSADTFEENILQGIWQCLTQDIALIQDDIRSLLSNSRDDPERFLSRLQVGLSEVRLRPLYWHDSDDPETWPGDAPGRFSLAWDARGIRETCYLLVALETQRGRLEECGRDGCNQRFIKRRNKFYCSEDCKQAARRERRSADPMEKPRRAVKARVERRRLDGLLTAEQEAEYRREINAAKTAAALRRIERKYGLEKRPPGRTPGQKAAKKEQA